MSKLQQLFDQINKSLLFDKTHNTILAGLEGLSALFAGAFYGTVFLDYKLRYVVLAIFFSILFLYLFFRRISRDNFFPLSVIGELESTIALNNSQRDIKRKVLIDGYIDDAIKSLNENTCNYNDNKAENNLCDTSLENGLKSVFSPFYTNPQNLLDIPTAKFTIGAYLDYVLKLPEKFKIEISALKPDSDIYISRDDLNLKPEFSKYFLSDQDLLGFAFDLQHQFLITWKEGIFIKKELSNKESIYSCITCPIPTVCEDGTTGVFFIICEKIDIIPLDFEKVCIIFSRLFSNWLNKYNECIIKRWDFENAKIMMTKKVDNAKAAHDLPTLLNKINEDDNVE